MIDGWKISEYAAAQLNLPILGNVSKILNGTCGLPASDAPKALEIWHDGINSFFDKATAKFSSADQTFPSVVDLYMKCRAFDNPNRCERRCDQKKRCFV
jgi:hypothetical protein